MVNEENKLNRTYTQKEFDQAVHEGYKIREQVGSNQLIELKNKLKDLELENKKLKEELNGKY